MANKSKLTKTNEEKTNDEIENIKSCLSEIATLAGYANYLSKYGLKRTEPAKRK